MRRGRQAWEAVSSRIVTTRLKLARRGQKIPVCWRSSEHSRKSTCVRCACLLGDFNACVGRRDPGSDLWQEALELHGLSERNEAGEEFLEFCATNKFTIMNTWFQKKEIHLGTWMHPAMKKHHIINFVVFREGQRMFCTDVRVMRGANCWSDHRMVRVKLRVKTIFSPRDKGKPTVTFATYLL